MAAAKGMKSIDCTLKENIAVQLDQLVPGIYIYFIFIIQRLSFLINYLLFI